MQPENGRTLLILGTSGHLRYYDITIFSKYVKQQISTSQNTASAPKGGSPIDSSGSVIGLIWRPVSGNLKWEGTEMRDRCYERDTGIGDFEERDSGDNHLNEPRSGMSFDENLWRIWSLSPWEAPGLQALQDLRGDRAISEEMKILSEAKLPIYQKSQ